MSDNNTAAQVPDASHRKPATLYPQGGVTPAVPEFRYFRDADGDTYKLPTNNSEGFKKERGRGEWERCIANLYATTYPPNMKEFGTIETDEHGTPLPALKGDDDNLEGPGPTSEQRAADFRELDRVAPTPADKFRLMFGQPLAVAGEARDASLRAIEEAREFSRVITENEELRSELAARSAELAAKDDIIRRLREAIEEDAVDRAVAAGHGLGKWKSHLSDKSHLLLQELQLEALASPKQ